MSSEETQSEALSRAQRGLSFSNYPAIMVGFSEKGIPESEIKPRVNVFTYQAWLKLGRQVRKGEHGVKVVTWIPIDEKRNASGEVTSKAGKRCKSATVFHESQTDAQGEESKQVHCNRQAGLPDHMPARPASPRPPTPQVKPLEDFSPLGYSEAT